MPIGIQFIGGKFFNNCLSSGASTFNDAQISDGADDITFENCTFGLQANTYNPQYAIGDSSSTPAVNSIIGGYIAGAAYTKWRLDSAVIATYHIVGVSQDQNHLPFNNNEANNLIVNNGLEKWGATTPIGFTTINGTETVSANNTNTYQSPTSAAITVTSAAAAQGITQQVNATNGFYKGSYVTLVADIFRTDSATSVGVEIREGDGSFTNKNAFNNIGHWQRIYVTRLITSTSTLLIRLYAKRGTDGSATTTAYFDNVKLVVGQNPDAFSVSTDEANVGFGTLTVNSTTPTITGYVNWKTANTAPTSITNFASPLYQGQKLNVWFRDANTTIKFSTSSTLRGNNGNDFVAPNNSFMQCVWDGSAWDCLVPAIQGNLGNVIATKFFVSSLNTAPSSSSDTGTTGEIRISSGYIYVCTATNIWVRTALTTW